MAEGERQLDRETTEDGDFEEFDIDAVTSLDDADEDPEGIASRLRSRAGSALSVRALAVSFVFTLVGALALGSVLPLGIVGNLLGIFVAAFASGTVGGTRRYLELGLAGGVLGGGLAFFGTFALSLLGPGVPFAAVGFVAGAIAAGLGHYFGRDLRDGLTRDL